ncbi:MAG: DnaJ domain-containing protein [Burkholderiales bacterium]
MATVKTLYTVLGVASDVEDQDIQQAFVRAKLRYPQAKIEVDNVARGEFLAIQQAFDTLSNEDARAAYDQKLARAGMPVIAREGATAAGGESMRIALVIGMIVLLISGMWTYYSYQRTKAEKEIAERALKLVEEEKQRKALLEQQEEQRRQARFDDMRKREADFEQQRAVADAERLRNQVSNDTARAEREAANNRQREQNAQAQAERNRQMQQRQVQFDAERRVAQEKQQLRAMCMQRYGRPDC